MLTEREVGWFVVLRPANLQWIRVKRPKQVSNATPHFHGKKRNGCLWDFVLPLTSLDPLSRTFKSRAKLPSLSPAPLAHRYVEFVHRFAVMANKSLSHSLRERRLRAKASWLSCTGYEMTMARRFSFCLDLYPCFCGSFFVSARQQRAGLRTDC